MFEDDRPTKARIERASKQKLMTARLEVEVLVAVDEVREHDGDEKLQYRDRYREEKAAKDAFRELLDDGFFVDDLLEDDTAFELREAETMDLVRFERGDLVLDDTFHEIDEWLEAKKFAQWFNDGRCRYTVDMFGDDVGEPRHNEALDAERALSELGRGSSMSERDRGDIWMYWAEAPGMPRVIVGVGARYRFAAEGLADLLRCFDAVKGMKFGIEHVPSNDESWRETFIGSRWGDIKSYRDAVRWGKLEPGTPAPMVCEDCGAGVEDLGQGLRECKCGYAGGTFRGSWRPAFEQISQEEE